MKRTTSAVPWHAIILVLSSATLLLAEESIEVRLDRLENTVVEARRKLSSGQFEAVVSYQDHRTPRDAYNKRYRVWFDNDRIRIDRSRGKNKWDKLVVAGDRFYWHLDDASVAAEMGEREYCKMASTDIFDPRILGLFPHQLEGLHAEQLKHFKQSQRSQPALESAAGEKVDSLIAKYRAGEVMITKQFAANADKCVEEVRYEWESVAKKMVDVVRSEYTEGAAYPTKVTYQRSLDSEKACTETVKLSRLVLGEPISDSIFSFEGMNVPADTLVIELPSNSKKVTAVWDGTKLTYPQKGPKRAAKESSRFSGYWILAAACAVIALASIRLLGRKVPAVERPQSMSLR